MGSKHKTFSLRLDDQLVVLTDELKEKNQLSILLRLFFTSLLEDKMSTVAFLMGQTDNGLKTRDTLLKGSLYSEYLNRGFKEKGVPFKDFVDDMDSVQLNSLGVSFGTGLTGEEVQQLVKAMGVELQQLSVQSSDSIISSETDFEKSVMSVLKNNLGILTELLGISKNNSSYGVESVVARKVSVPSETVKEKVLLSEDESTMDADYLRPDELYLRKDVDMGSENPTSPKITDEVINDEDTSTSGFIAGFEGDEDDDEIIVTEVSPEEEEYTSGFDILDGLGIF